jgi:desulfoferrodoxin-like iron-binding protein
MFNKNKSNEENNQNEEKYISDIYICNKCKQEVIIVKVGKGTLKCCDRPMKKITDEDSYEYSEEDEEAEE